MKPARRWDSKYCTVCLETRRFWRVTHPERGPGWHCELCRKFFYDTSAGSVSKA